MKLEQIFANIELKFKDKVKRVKLMVDTGASKSVISRKIAEELGALTLLEKPYYLYTAQKDGKIKIIGYCNLDIKFEGVEIPGGTRFEVAEDVREDFTGVIGRPEIDSWDIIFTKEGPRLRKVPVEFKII